MTIQIQLTPAIESGLAALARMKGLPLNEYIQTLLEPLAMASIPIPTGETPEQRADAFTYLGRTVSIQAKGAASGRSNLSRKHISSRQQ